MRVTRITVIPTIYRVFFKPCSLEINSNGELKQGYEESCSLTTKKTLYLHHRNAYGYQIWQGDDLTTGSSHS